MMRLLTEFRARVHVWSCFMCNNGWMSELEGWAQEHFGRFVEPDLGLTTSCRSRWPLAFLTSIVNERIIKQHKQKEYRYEKDRSYRSRYYIVRRLGALLLRAK